MRADYKAALATAGYQDNTIAAKAVPSLALYRYAISFQFDPEV